jgi:nucleoside-diphosphate-sugar epimerase
LSALDWEVVGIDRTSSQDVEACDVTNLEDLLRAFEMHAPTHVLNLAGDTDLSIPTLSGYRANIVGTQNVVTACAKSSTIVRLVHVSTQHVCRTAEPPSSDLQFEPDTYYATSKVISELLVRQLHDTEWVITRPTNIWGPGHPLLADGFWRELAKGRYLHPSHDRSIRGYGYVTNAADQFISLLTAENAAGRVVYVTDEPIRQADWVDAFALAITGRRARRAPRAVLAAIAVAGELLRRVGAPAPLYWSRYQSMVRSQRVPFEATVALAGPPSVSLEEGVRDTVAWLEARDTAV